MCAFTTTEQPPSSCFSQCEHHLRMCSTHGRKRWSQRAASVPRSLGMWSGIGPGFSCVRRLLTFTHFLRPLCEVLEKLQLGWVKLCVEKGMFASYRFSFATSFQK